MARRLHRGPERRRLPHLVGGAVGGAHRSTLPRGAGPGRDHDITEVLSLAFTDTALPNRAELRLRSSGKAIGYTMCRITDRDGTVSGAALLFKDLTRVEQIEERERLRDRLAVLCEMATAIAHEVKNPLARIQVVAGVRKRQLPESPDAHALLNDIINEAKMANQIVVQLLEFVRPMSLQVESVSITTVTDDAMATIRSLPAAGRARSPWTETPSFPGSKGTGCNCANCSPTC